MAGDATQVGFLVGDPVAGLGAGLGVGFLVGDPVTGGATQVGDVGSGFVGEFHAGAFQLWLREKETKHSLDD